MPGDHHLPPPIFPQQELERIDNVRKLQQITKILFGDGPLLKEEGAYDGPA